MTDGTGSTGYSYNSLSQMTSEVKSFTGLSGSLTLGYEYSLAGELQKITDPSSVAINYTYDKTGRMNTVTGSGTLLSNVTNYASNIRYRAWGSVKALDYGNSTSTSVTYNNRLLIASYAASGIKDTSTSGTHSEGGEFTYYPDGQIKYATDTRMPSLHNRAFAYDHAGRMKEGYSSYQATDYLNGTTTQYGGDVPFRHSYTYDAFDNRTSRTGLIWSEFDEGTDEYNSQGRHSGWGYDADGRFTTANESAPNEFTYSPLTFTYDAAGQKATQTQTMSRPRFNNPSVADTTVSSGNDYYDGNGVLVKKTRTTQFNSNSPITNRTYDLRSSVTGNVIAEYNGSGVKTMTNVYAGGTMVAQQSSASTPSQMFWPQVKPLMGDGVNTDSSGVVLNRVSPDPVAGFNVGDTNPFEFNSGTDEGNVGGSGILPGLAAGLNGCQAIVDGMTVECRLANTILAVGAGV